MKQPDRANVGIQVQPETQREEYLSCVALVRHAWVADCAEKNGIEIFSEHFKRARRERNAFSEVSLRPPIELHKFKTGVEDLVYTLQHPHRFTRHIDADTIAGDDCDPLHCGVMSAPVSCIPLRGPANAILHPLQIP